MGQIKLCIVAGARPNFMKIAPIIRAMDGHNGRHLKRQKRIEYILVHTGQHYDERMSKLFFDDLDIPPPHVNLEVGSASHAVQTGEIMKGFEKVCMEASPTHILVVGDVNSTIACALVASKCGIKIIHVEAGLRSFDRSMPEEINRVLTDAISDFLFTTEESANNNLLCEGIPTEKIYFVGNVMIDTLLKNRKKAERSDILYSLGLNNSQPNGSTCSINPYAVLTLHRPSNVDKERLLKGIIGALTEISKKIPIIFPTHPRTLNSIKEFGFENHFKWFSSRKSRLGTISSGIYCVDPLGYLDFLHLISNSKLVLTDSGGIQEETTILGIPCVTLRENTERPITVTHGTNVIAGLKKGDIIKASLAQLEKSNKPLKKLIPPLWDGKAAKRILKILLKSA